MNALQRDLKRLVPMVEAAGAARAAADPHRQKLHVQPPVGWLNDPNGLCQIGDEYHVFYQYGPFDPTGGVKHWGHVRSRDLFHWERLPVMHLQQTGESGKKTVKSLLGKMGSRQCGLI